MSASSRRSVLLAAGGMAILAGLEAFVLEPRRLTVTRHQLGGRRNSRPLRIAQLTDLHLMELGDFESEVARTTLALEPDVILLTGDSIDQRKRAGAFEEFLSLLGRSIPTYAVLGNWDRWADISPDGWRALYERHGIQLLVNESATVSTPAGTLRLTGVDDLVTGTPSIPNGMTTDDGAPHLLLSHCPAYRVQAAIDAPNRFTAMLSGHTHGGQVRILGIAPILPRGSGGYVSGWYHDAGMPPLYVSRGIGTSGIHARFYSPPEIALFEIG